MFEQNTKVHVNMTGEEYIKYKQKKKFKLSKQHLDAAPYFIMVVVGIVFIIAILNALTPEQMGIEEKFQAMIINPLDYSYGDLGKFIIYNYSTAIIFFIGVSWLIHGFGFFLVR